MRKPHLLPLAAVLAALALPASAAAAAPHRTTQEAELFLEQRLDGHWSTLYCLGDATERPGTARYRRFTCLVGTRTLDAATGAVSGEGATAYRLDTRPRGHWSLRTLR